MNSNILLSKVSKYQLISLAIELTHKLISLEDCTPELISNSHVSRAVELAKQWNEVFMQVYVTREGN